MYRIMRRRQGTHRSAARWGRRPCPIALNSRRATSRLGPPDELLRSAQIRRPQPLQYGLSAGLIRQPVARQMVQPLRWLLARKACASVAAAAAVPGAGSRCRHRCGALYCPGLLGSPSAVKCRLRRFASWFSICRCRCRQQRRRRRRGGRHPCCPLLTCLPLHVSLLFFGDYELS